jgi:hypothetical protein
MRCFPPRRGPGYTGIVSRKTGRSRPYPARGEAPARGRARVTGAARQSASSRPAQRGPAPWLRPFALAKWIVWGGVTFVLFYFTAVLLEKQITWYLAVDQFGYLTFAHDLLHGRVFHEWAPLKALEPFFPGRTDALAQTYVYDDGRLYCRYSPGFPILLASWIGLLGDDRAHYLNPTLYLVLLAVALAFQWRMFRSPWRATAGTALIALFPTMMYLWGLTLTRDLSAHVFAFGGLFLLLPARGKPIRARRLLAAGAVLGFAIAIRPDAVLYLLPATLMLAVRGWHERRRLSLGGTALAALALAVGIGAGASPFFAYNWAATGNPFIPTQGMELPILPSLPPPPPKPRQFRPSAFRIPEPARDAKVGFPSPGWRGGTLEQVQGGGLQLAHLSTTLRGNWTRTLRAYTPLLFGVALWGAVIATVMRPMLAAGAVSYAVVAFLFFSCWPRPDFRYLIGVFVFLPMLVIEGTLGTLDLVRMLWKRHQPDLARGLAVFAAGVFLAGAAMLRPTAPDGLSLPIFLVVTITTGVAAALVVLDPSRRVVALAAPVLMLGLVWCKMSEVQALGDRRAPFQRAQMVEARTNMQHLLEPKAVVITTEEVGRPAENIEYYSGIANALYLTDLQRWHVSVHDAAVQLVVRGMRPYLYIPANQADGDKMIADLRSHFTVDLVADIPAQRAMANFVAAPFHRGVRMLLYRISWPEVENALRAHEAATSSRPPAAGTTAR